MNARDRRRALGAGVALAAALTLAAAPWPRDEGCSTLDRRLGIAEGPEGWSAEARYQRWDDGDRCRARIRVAFFEPGGTWEDEALVPASILEAPADPARPPDATMRWRDGHVVVGAASFDADAVTRGARARGPGRPSTQ